MRDDHAGELAELYALGQLSDPERDRVEAHARTCDVCARRLGEAEAAVLALIESGEVAAAAPAQLGRRPAFARYGPRPAWIVAIAAAFLLGLLPWGLTQLRRPAETPGASQQLAMNAMLAGHFLHAPFAALVPGAPNAKAIYPREGGWLYVLVGPATQPIGVVAIAGNRRTTIATIPPGTQARAAFATLAWRVSSVELVANGTAVGSARIVYAAPAP